MDIQWSKYTEREAKKILKEAIKRQYAIPKEEGIDSSQLVKLASEAGISSDNLKDTIKDYQARKSRRNNRLKRIGGLALAVGISAGIYSMVGVSSNKEPEYVRATITYRDDGSAFVSRSYMDLRFNIEGQPRIEFRARLSQCDFSGCDKRYDLLSEVINENSEIEINEEKLHEFEVESDIPIRRGKLNPNDIRILQR